MKQSGIKIRWITTTGFEVVLPNEKVIIFDPWVGKEYPGVPGFSVDTGFSVDDYTGADYIFLSHGHFDHVANVAELLEKKQPDTCGGHVFLPALSSKMFSDIYDIPLPQLVPLFPYETMDLDDLIVTPLPCRHFGDVGLNENIKPSITLKAALEKGTMPPAEIEQSHWGSLEELDWAITIKENGFRFMVLGGRVYRFNNIYKYADEFCPDLVIRQVSVGTTPERYAEMIHRYHAPYVFPSHHDSHDVAGAQGISMEEYFKKVNKKLEEMNSITRVVDIEHCKWYNLGVYCNKQ